MRPSFLSLSLFAGLLVGLAWISPVSAQGPSGKGAAAFLEALRTAQSSNPGLVLLLSRHEKAGWGFYFWDGRTVLEMEINGKRILKQQTITPSAKDNISQQVIDALVKYKGAKLPFGRYLEIAQESNNSGDVVGVKIDLSGENLVVKVTLEGGSVATMDMGTGKLQSK